ncbi:Oxo-4-hydroxy-4-carboxy-5-ureidoimidazoline decarboxylase [Xylaria sp. CBS 124048]|nr:Oxo-4-hydroxy-4-carboxy-5-ureidoimidazoline decarboxylase [Xylaria sp. CBS 124048]
MAAQLPPISTLQTLPQESQIAVLSTLFEPSKDLQALTLPLPFSQSYEDLITSIGGTLNSLAAAADAASSSAAQAILHRILGSHPRLGAKKVDSAQSRAEQAQLSKGNDPTESERLATLNREYEDRFPGLRYVVFVNGRGRDIVMEDMRRRIERGDIRAEEREAMQAMTDIALDRARKLGAT